MFDIVLVMLVLVGFMAFAVEAITAKPVGSEPEPEDEVEEPVYTPTREHRLDFGEPWHSDVILLYPKSQYTEEGIESLRRYDLA